ncbi:MAG: DUF2182 domain-containing protein [Candidatus Nanopelagicales bacterium]
MNANASALRQSVRPNRTALTLSVVVVSTLAWALLAWAGEDFNHHGLGGQHEHVGDRPILRAYLTVTLGWMVMVVAMMLPPALPMLDLMGRLVARHRRRRLLIGSAVAAFIAVWTVTGIALVAGDGMLHRVADRVDWVATHQHVVAGSLLVMAGGYQFSPLKDACLRACRTPRGFAVEHWRGRRPAWMEAVSVSGAYAVSCVGCCWALMTVSFAVGVAALPVMVALAGIMATERLTTWGRKLVRPVGLLLIVGGCVAIAGGLPDSVLAG